MPVMPSPTRRRIAVASTLAIAACLFDASGLLAADAVQGASGRVLMQLTPAQDFRPSDGRQMDVPAWRINDEIAGAVLAAFNPAQPLVIDYEHQTLYTEANGQPAPAAAWMHALRWLPERGLFAEVELTARARQLVESGEYRYFSPVFEYDRASGAIKRVVMGALTNNPAIAGMQAIDLTAAATARFNPNPQETDVTLLQKLIAALMLPANTTEEAALAACAARKAQADAALAALKLQTDAGADAVTAACAAQVKPAAATPDPAQYVPVGVVQELQHSVAVLSAAANARAIDDLVMPALAEGRLLPTMEKWARDLGKDNLAALTAYLKDVPPIAALAGSQTNGQAPAGKDANGLTADERAVAAACGLTPEQYATGRATA